MPGQNAIAEFLITERSRLLGYVRRLINDMAERDGEDIVQDVALNLFSRSDLSIPIENLSAYVYKAVRNRVVDYLRRRKKLVSLDESLVDGDELSLGEVLSDPVLGTEDQMNRSEIRRRVLEAIAELSDDQKAVVIETELNGRGYKELAESWGIPQGTLLARKHRAMKRVRLALEDLKP